MYSQIDFDRDMSLTFDSFAHGIRNTKMFSQPFKLPVEYSQDVVKTISDIRLFNNFPSETLMP